MRERDMGQEEGSWWTFGVPDQIFGGTGHPWMLWRMFFYPKGTGIYSIVYASKMDGKEITAGEGNKQFC